MVNLDTWEGCIFFFSLALRLVHTVHPSSLSSSSESESQIHRDRRAKGVETLDLPPESLFLSSGFKQILGVSTCTTEEGAGIVKSVSGFISPPAKRTSEINKKSRIIRYYY